MAKLTLSFLILLSILLSTTTQNIEKAFLQNNPKMLYALLASEGHINISFPDPISFSDQLSNQQAYFLFQKIFSSYTTFEFYSERQTFPTDAESFIFKARWSFKDKKNNNQYAYHLFFYLLKVQDQKSKIKKNWEISEIKAEKI